MIFTQKHKVVVRVYLILLSILSIILASGIGLAFAVNTSNKNIENFIQEKPALPSVILDINGKVISELVGEEQRILLEFNEIPKEQVFALISREDTSFFEHSGFNVKGFFRALFFLIIRGNTDAGGGSSLTNQIAKDRLGNMYKRNVLTKLHELWASWQLERQYSKNEIMQIYLNKVNFGHGNYGIEAISQFFFGHGAKENDVAEAAITSIQMAYPGKYSPFRRPKTAKYLQKQVIDQMVENGFTTKEEADLAFANYWNTFDWSMDAENNAQSTRTKNDKAQWFTEYVRGETKKHLFGTRNILKDGYKIHTTLDLDFQAAADKYVLEKLESVREGYKVRDKAKKEVAYGQFAPIISLMGLVGNIPEIKVEEKIADRQQKEKFQEIAIREWRILSLLTGNTNLNKIAIDGAMQKNEERDDQIETALLTVENSTGQIRAMIGGSKFESTNQYNRALDANVSPGSSFKPLYFSAGISSDQLTAGTHFVDQPKSFEMDGREPYTPGNYGGKWRGNVLLRYALNSSLNIPAIEVLETIGFDAAIERSAKLLGILDRKEVKAEFGNQRYFSLALGTNAVSPAQMARAYTAFANAGRAVEPYGIRFIEDQRGQIIVHVEDEMLQKSYNPLNQVMSPQDAYIMTNIMETTLQPGGTLNYGRRIVDGFDGMAMAGKTGTSQNWQHAWTIGYSPYYTTAVWYGFDKGSNTLGQNNNGAELAGPIWAKYMKDIHKGLPKKDFHRPQGIVERVICRTTGDLATQKCPSTIREVFKAGTEPTQYDTYHTVTEIAKEKAIINILDDLIIEFGDNEIWKPIEDDLIFNPDDSDDDFSDFGSDDDSFEILD